ncbi:MAG: lasso peptide biosynthesis B2 protein [Gammaproteobacteria bacterium]|nr:lasso peptide biosynthesis B2 protein [Gammaproteobacteria bacterium]
MTSKPQKSKLRRFMDLDSADRLLLIRAVGWLAIARIRLAVTPFDRLAEGLARRPEPAQRKTDPRLPERIGFVVRAAANNVPWRSDCFPQAIAAREMLGRCGYASTIHLGVDKVDEDNIAGHAWLTCGDTVVTGGETMDRYSEVHRL